MVHAFARSIWMVFIENAKKNMVDNGRQYLYCPCNNCKNEKRYLQEDVLKSHLIKRGFTEVVTPETQMVEVDGYDPLSKKKRRYVDYFFYTASPASCEI
jgi:hypothetical protein